MTSQEEEEDDRFNNMKVLTYFRYRTGMVVGNRTTFPRLPMRSFEEKLAKLAGVRPDNHVCYKVDLGNYSSSGIKYFMFSDFWMLMGDEIKEGNW